MKRTFKYIGFILILMLSFFYTEKAALIVKDVDEIMLKIRERKIELDKKPLEAIITEKTIIPGVNGYEIDVNKSYQKMRYIGKYNDNYLKFKTINPKNTLDKNKEKIIISGNKSKKAVSVVLISTSKNDMNFFGKIDDRISLFIDGNLVEQQKEKMKEVYNITGTISYNYDYNNPNYVWLDDTVKKISNTKNSYCLINDINLETGCEKYDNYTVYGKIISKNPLLTTRNQIENGKILVYEVNDSLMKEIDAILDFITAKGYDILKLDKLLQE